MKIKAPGNFVLPNVDIKTGDYITILNEGEYRTIPGQEKEVLTFQIELPSGVKKSFTMNPTSQTRFLVAFGDNSKDWIGKRAKVEVVKQKVFKEMKDVIYLYPEGSKDIPEEEITE